MANLRGGLTGGAGGAFVGAKLGSIVPGFGTTAGAIAGGAAGFVGGLFGGGDDKKDKELQAFGRKQLSGAIDPVSANAIQGALSRRFNQLRAQQGAGLSRRGLRRSTIANRELGKTFDLERQALTDAFARQQFSRQQLGANILSGQQNRSDIQSQQNADVIGEIAFLAASL
jgi:hypothetical protein